MFDSLRARIGQFVLASLLVFLVAFAPSLAADEAKAKKQGPAAEPPTVTRLVKMPNAITVAELSNGLTVLVQENHVAPVATVRCFVKNTGSAFESQRLGMGLSHLIEHLTAGGATTNRSEDEIEQLVNSFGGATNAYTSSDVTAYFIDCPAKNTLTAIDLVSDQMQHAAFEPAAFKREHEVVQRELADGEVNRGRVQWRMLGETVYTVHPARCPVIGYLDVLRRATRDDCVAFYRERYVPNNQVFVVVGDVKTDDVLARVAKAWTGTGRAPETYVSMFEEPEQMSPREAFREMDGATYDMALAWPTVKLTDKDLYALDVASYILSAGDSTRLVRSLKYEKQLVLSVGAASHTPHYAKGLFAVMASCRPETWRQADAEILREVYRLRDELVSPAELAKAKKQKAAELVFSQQTVQEAAESLGRSYLSAADPLFDQAYVENIQKVTAEDIRDVARRYFTPSRLNRVVVAPPGGAPKVSEKASAGGETPIQLAKLSNGVRVLVKRQANLPMVNIQAHVLCGSLADDPTTAGRAGLVGAMLEKGTADQTSQQIADYFDSIGGRFATGATRSTLTASATVLRDDLPKAADLLAECFLRPTFPESEFAKVKRLALGAIAQRSANPHAEAFEVFFDSLPATSPYHVMDGGKKETVERLSVDDLRAYHAKYMTPESMVVTIFGDVEPKEALALAERLFGKLPKSGKKPELNLNGSNAIGKSIVRHKRTNKPTGMVMIGYPAVSVRQEKDHAALTVLDAILSGYDYPGGWLHHELRGEGLVYFVHAAQLTGPAPGYFFVFCQTGPDKIDEVVARIHKNLERAKRGDIPEDEFRRAVQMILAMHAQDNTTISSQAGQAAMDELLGLGYDHDRAFDARLQAVTLPDVVAAAKKYLTNSVRVTTSPEERKP